jgi:hypothetical protein
VIRSNSGLPDGLGRPGQPVKPSQAEIGGGGEGAAVGTNQVGGNVQVNNNSGSSASLVGGNTIGGNLQFARNTPGVTDEGVPNTVTGTKQGQCAGL